MIARFFSAHPEAVGESYTEHSGVASRFGLRMVLAGLACLVYAVLLTCSNRGARVGGVG